MKKSNKRFVVVEKEGALESRSVLVDRETGVNYLWIVSGSAAGLTVLVDAEGKPIVTPIPEEEEN